MSKGGGTRSGLLWEVERLLNETENLPQILVMENVPQVHAKKNTPDFQNWLDYLKCRGYKTFWKDMNAADYGIPQSRKRCFTVSVLGDYEFRFPAPIPLERVMRDYLEDEVDEKYYLTSDKAKELIDNLVFNGKIIGECGLKDKVSFSATVSEPLDFQQFGYIGTGKHQSNTVYGSDEPSTTITTASRKEQLKVVEWQKINIIGHMDNTKDHTFESANRVYNSSGLCPTIPTCGGGGIQPKVLDVMPLRMVRTEEGKNIRKLYETGKIHHKFNEYREADPRTDGLINTITTVQKDNILCEVSIINEIPEQFQRFVYVINGELYLIRIRKLTPLECWRLMGFSDEDFHKAESVVSNTQLYKQAGNSIVKQVLMKIFEQILNLY